MQSLPALAARRAGLALACAAAATPAALSQSARIPFPLQPDGSGDRMGSPILATDLAGVGALTDHERVVLTEITLPGGEVVALDLERIDVGRRRFGVHVDGQLAPDALDGLDLTVWKGSIAGDENSQVMLGFSTHGSRGWIRTRTELVHLLAAPAADGAWRAASGVLVTERHLNALGHAYDGDCSARPPAVSPVPGGSTNAPALSPSPGGLRTVDTIGLRECTIAMETDWQLYQLFNDLNAATSYLTTLLSFISDRYESQASTVLTFPYLQIYTTPNDPWNTPDNGGGSVDMLNELRAAWQGNVPMGATLGHMMSGAGLGGGVAWLDVLCSNQFNFGVSGNISGSVGFPVVQQPANWDFIVVAHELGHNFASPHTHDFCPPLDECAPSGYFGQCQSTQQCTNMGTIMSYCHLCSGGTGNITTFFHPEAAALMTNASAACNPAVFEVIVDAPGVVSDTAPTQTMLQVTTGAITAPVLNYRVTGAAGFTQVAMTAMGGGLFLGDIPPVPCGDTVEYWFEFDATGIGALTAPAGAPTSLYDAIGGFDQILFADDFESDLGWQATNLGASSGAWERGVPVNDGGWTYDPESDFDGSGSCFLTENAAGNTDIDGGAVELVSPTFDMSPAGATVSYAYYLFLTNEDGSDRILVEASVGGGPWTEVARHDTSAGLAWRTAEITAADFVAAGVAPGPSTRLRFTANDDNPQSIVEAGLDAFQVSFVDCGGLGVTYCDPAAVNSTGAPATLSAEGSDVATANDVTLTADSLPANATGFFLTSSTRGFVPNAGGSSGNLCLGGSVGRYVGPGQVRNSGAAGTYSLALDLAQTPQPNGFVTVVAGQTWNFQSWYRDSLAGIPTSNFTDAVEIVFQ